MDSERVSVLHAALLEELLVGDPEWERQQPQPQAQARQSPDYDTPSRERERYPGGAGAQTLPPSPPQRTNALSEADCRQLVARVASDEEELQRAVLANYAAQSKVRTRLLSPLPASAFACLLSLCLRFR